MHITRLQAENVKKLSAIDIKPGTTAGIVPIRGRNAQGKSSTLDAIQWALGGKGVMPSRPVRKGADEGAIRLELDDGALIVRRTFTDDGGGQIVVESAEGARYPSPQKMLDGLYASVAFDPLAFTRLDAGKQFEVLRRLVKLDVDIDALAAANKADYAERTLVNREVKQREAQLPAARPQGIIPPALVDEDALSARIAEAGEHNVAIERRISAREQAAVKIREHQSAAARWMDERARLLREAEQAEERANAAQAEADALQERLDAAEPLPEPINVVQLAAELRAAREGNRLVLQAAEYKALEASLQKRREDAEALTKAMAERDKQRAEAIGRAEMPVPGLSFGEEQVLFNGLPLDQASSAEQLRVSTAIGMASAPKLRVMLVRDGSLLDDEGQQILAELAEQNGFQLWVEAVDTTGKVGIVIEDGAVAAIDGEAAPAPEPIEGRRRRKAKALEESGQNASEDSGLPADADAEEITPDPDPDMAREDRDERRRMDDEDRRSAPVSLFD